MQPVLNLPHPLISHITKYLYIRSGRQGSSVVRSLVQNPTFHVRAITRNPSSSKAKELASLGAELVKADGFNRQELQHAFSGSWGAFVNTNSEDPVRIPSLSPCHLTTWAVVLICSFLGTIIQRPQRRRPRQQHHRIRRLIWRPASSV